MVRTVLNLDQTTSWIFGAARAITYFFRNFPLCYVAALMSTVYEEQKDEDGFLYVQYSGESTFG